MTVRLADFDIPEKVPKERKLSHLFSYMMVHTHKLGQRFCRSLTRAIVLSIKRKTIFIAEHQDYFIARKTSSFIRYWKSFDEIQNLIWLLCRYAYLYFTKGNLPTVKMSTCCGWWEFTSVSWWNKCCGAHANMKINIRKGM